MAESLNLVQNAQPSKENMKDVFFIPLSFPEGLFFSRSVKEKNDEDFRTTYLRYSQQHCVVFAILLQFGDHLEGF